MKTKQLTKQTCLNPYFLECGPQIEKIHFFGGGEIIATQNRGWLSIYGGNSSGCSALEAIEYRNKRKADLKADYSFYIGNELYVNINALPGFLFAPGVIELTTEDATYYGDRVYFECGSTDGRHAHHETVELRSFMIGGYSKITPTARGRKVSRIVDVFKDAGITLSKYDASKMLKESKSILKVMKSKESLSLAMNEKG